MSTMATSWRSAAAEALEAQEEAVLAAISGLDALEGLYAERPELRDAVQASRSLLEVDATNLRHAAKRLRDGA